jgi:transposase
MGPAFLLADPTAEVAHWRERAERAEASLASVEAELGEARTKIAKLTEQVATLSRMMFGRSSERGGQAGGVPDPDQVLDDEAETDPAADRASGKQPNQPKGQQRGSRGHGRRDYRHLPTVEIIHDVPAEQRFCSCCGLEFEALDAECSEQLDWQVTVTRVVHKRLRYRRRCRCAGRRTVTAPPAPNPVPKGRLTHHFLARLLFFKYGLSRYLLP